MFIDDEISQPSQPQFVTSSSNSNKSTKFSQVGFESDFASLSSSANGSNSYCEERERLKNPRSRPNYLKATSSSEKKKMINQVLNLPDSESSTISYDEKKPILQNTKSKASLSFKRNTSMRTLRILMSKSKKGSQEMSCPQVPEGEGVIRATCSSALKDSKLPLVEVEPGERETEKISALRVCTYSYCSLHGHHNHSSTPSLKRLLSKRRRFSKTQNGVRIRTQSSARESSTNDLLMDTKSRQLVVGKDSKGEKKGKNSKIVSSKSKVKVAKGDESISEPIGDDEIVKNNESGDGKKRRMSMWYLIHQQMVSGLAEGRGYQELETQKTGSENKDIGNQRMGTEDKETGNQDLEMQKTYAIKMVREAIEKILLPEVPDQSPDEMSIRRGAPSKQVPTEKQNCSEDFQQEENAKNKAPKSWSNLKKLILLKRFVKELETVKKINTRKSMFLPLGPDKEGERASLRCKGLDTKRSAEEWMLDYALQQAVSELAPTQKKKVELLIKAYETMVPSSDGEQSPLLFPKLKSIRSEGVHFKGVHCDNESNALVEEKMKEGRKKDECSLSEQSQKVDDVINDWNEDDSKESLVSSSSTDSGTIEQFTKDEEVDNVDVDSLETRVNREISLMDSNSEKLEIDEGPMAKDFKHGPIIDSETENRLRAFKSRFTKPKNMSMWHLIHQQMVAGLKDEGKTKENESKNENEEGAVDGNIGSESDDVECQEVELRKVFAIKMVREAIEKILLPEVQDQSSDDQSTSNETVSEQGLVEKKQDEDWGSQIFNSFGSTIEDPAYCSSNKVMYEISLTQEGAALGSTQELNSETEKKEPKIEKRAEKQAPKRWSNLKKWIVLQRFVKELEKVKEFNPKKPQLLPLKLDPEGEVVRLTNQMTNEKRSAEEWMLDYALRKVVSELAPKQKRKVELLVKAFETVVPPTEETRSPLTFPKSKSTEVAKLKNIFTPKIDDENNDSAKAVEKSDVISPSRSRDMKLGGLGGDSSGKLIASEENEKKIFELKSIGKLTNKTQSDKQKHMKMWHLLCQHVVSDIAIKVENQHLYGEDHNVLSPFENSTFDQERVNEDRKVEFSKSDAVKLVRGAIEEILVPDIQEDSSDTLSIASDISADHELLEEKKSGNWDKLKKIIILKRSIKALEKARKLNPRVPHHLPFELGQEEEKVDLKHRLSDERKKAEEWMLDYAVQHIVTKLTPARKKRVSMLVEAFEAVVPLPQI